MCPKQKFELYALVVAVSRWRRCPRTDESWDAVGRCQKDAVWMVIFGKQTDR